VTARRPAKAATPATSATYGGTPRPITTKAALAAEIARTNAAVEWLQGQIAALAPTDLIRGTKFVRRTESEKDGTSTTTEAGAVRHELLALYLEERRHLHALIRDGLAHLDADDARRAALARAVEDDAP
jgi:hypothetical protein